MVYIPLTPVSYVKVTQFVLLLKLKGTIDGWKLEQRSIKIKLRIPLVNLLKMINKQRRKKLFFFFKFSIRTDATRDLELPSINEF